MKFEALDEDTLLLSSHRFDKKTKKKGGLILLLNQATSLIKYIPLTSYSTFLFIIITEEEHDNLAHTPSSQQQPVQYHCISHLHLKP